MIYANIRNCNTQYAYIRNLRNTIILYAPIRTFTQMVYTHRYAGYTQMIYAFNTHDTQSIRNRYAINTQWYAIAIRKSIRIHTHVYAFHIRNSQYAIAQNVNTHDTQIPFFIRINTHPYAMGSLLMITCHITHPNLPDVSAAWQSFGGASARASIWILDRCDNFFIACNIALYAISHAISHAI